MTTTGHHDREHPVLAAVLLAQEHLAALAEDSLWSLNGAATVDLLHATSALTAQVAELEARAITHAETLNLPDEAGMRSMATWLARTTHLTGGAACRKVRLAHTTTNHEPTREALAAGQIHVEQAEAITTAVDQLDDDTTVVSPADRARAETHLLDQAADHDAHDLTASANASSPSWTLMVPMPTKPACWSARKHVPARRRR